MQKLRAELQKEAVKIDAEMEMDLRHLAASHEPQLIEVLRYGLLGGGKRVRPFLVLMAAALCGEVSEERYRLAIAFEYLHAATLFHDDIIDQSEMRRGQLAVHGKYGVVAAILAGDFLLTHSMEIVGLHSGQRGLQSFNLATKGMVDGEFWQLRNAQSYSLSEHDYDEVVMRKTGLLIAGACEVGGIFAGGSEKELAALRCYGENLGRAFQIVDDLLDYQGDSSKTGKATGNDLKEGKMTLPLIIAINNAEREERARMQAILQDTTLRAERKGFVEMTTLIERNGGFQQARERAEQGAEKGVTALNLFAGTGERQQVKDVLNELSLFVLNREK